LDAGDENLKKAVLELSTLLEELKITEKVLAQ
jgi:hypothetical protein